MTIFIGGAWPYANGSLHIGHIASLLPGDILARYYRLKGEQVCYVSGSDCHGTPIEIRALQEGIRPEAVAQRYHEEFAQNFCALGFSYDYYGKTDEPSHKAFVQQFIRALYDAGALYEQQVLQHYCRDCVRFLSDRYVRGLCPRCGSSARGDSCEACGALLEPETLLEKQCALCGNTPDLRNSSHLYLRLSAFTPALKSYITQTRNWRANAFAQTEQTLREGLKDRAVTRDLAWGIETPIPGYEGKRIYVWIEAVLGYLSASKAWADAHGIPWQQIWSEESLHYYVHGKDNIPFHTLILPALLKARGGLKLPDHILSSEYLTLEGRKISTSQGWALWIPDLLKRYDPDSLRYFLTISGPEKRDTDFTWREFIHSHNGELLGAWGNFVHRTLVFIHKSFQARIPKGRWDPARKEEIQTLFPHFGAKIEAGAFKDALESLFANIRSANRYFDERRPWITLREDPEHCSDTLFTCVQWVFNLSRLLHPFLPFSSEKLQQTLQAPPPAWSFSELPPGGVIQTPEVLFQRIDKDVIEEENQKLRRA